LFIPQLHNHQLLRLVYEFVLSLAAMSNRCWLPTNEFTNSLHRLWKMRSWTQFQVNLKIIIIIIILLPALGLYIQLNIGGRPYCYTVTQGQWIWYHLVDRIW